MCDAGALGHAEDGVLGAVRGRPSDAADETIENFERVTAVNQRGVWACMKHELRVMRDQGHGAIVNCSSLGGLVGLPKRAAYHGTKQSLVRALPMRTGLMGAGRSF